MAALKTVIIWLSYLFHFAFALLLLAFAAIALTSGPGVLHLGMLPWTGLKLEYVLLGGALFGLFSVALAITKRMRALFLIWSLVVAVMLTKGCIFSGYRFSAGEWRHARYLILASWVAVAGAWVQIPRQPARRPHKYRVK